MIVRARRRNWRSRGLSERVVERMRTTNEDPRKEEAIKEALKEVVNIEATAMRKY